MRVLLPIALAVLASGCGGSSPEDEARSAYDDFIAALRDRDVEVVCRKLFPSTLLPEAVGKQLDVTEIDRNASTADWRRSERQCRNDFGDNGEFESAKPLDNLSVVEVTRVKDFRPVQGITDAAMVGLEGESEQAPMVRFDGDWKVVAIVG